MAKKVTVELVDDYDGESKAEETIRFAIDGVEYEIDLSTLNAGKLRETLEPWVKPARKVGRIARGKRTVGTSRTSTDKAQSAAIREWARKNGYDVSSRGRIQGEVIEAYNKAS
ncbi:Lsr2 family protein [Nocardia sp. NPDC004068]|uniref:histone-like nucleoid-structuring protein Lsr2 n=1 Tax=Nocardia sp. NPDC004068 TaxID=3364303 RepID=UPI0036A515E0